MSGLLATTLRGIRLLADSHCKRFNEYRSAWCRQCLDANRSISLRPVPCQIMIVEGWLSACGRAQLWQRVHTVQTSFPVEESRMHALVEYCLLPPVCMLAMLYHSCDTVAVCSHCGAVATICTHPMGQCMHASLCSADSGSLLKHRCHLCLKGRGWNWGTVSRTPQRGASCSSSCLACRVVPCGWSRMHCLGGVTRVTAGALAAAAGLMLRQWQASVPANAAVVVLPAVMVLCSMADGR